MRFGIGGGYGSVKENRSENGLLLHGVRILSGFVFSFVLSIFWGGQDLMNVIVFLVICLRDYACELGCYQSNKRWPETLYESS